MIKHSLRYVRFCHHCPCIGAQDDTYVRSEATNLSVTILSTLFRVLGMSRTTVPFCYYGPYRPKSVRDHFIRDCHLPNVSSHRINDDQSSSNGSISVTSSSDSTNISALLRDSFNTSGSEMYPRFSMSMMYRICNSELEQATNTSLCFFPLAFSL